jgi:Restriction endonuclease
MSSPPPSLDIAPPQIVLVAEGDSPSTQANARGHLFERFAARIFEAYGCDAPTTSTLNVRANGYEVDITTRMTLTKSAAIAECKAYSSPLPVSALNSFYGKLCTERLDNPDTHGWFVVIPGLTSDGHQLARKLEEKDKAFRVITATDIYELVRHKAWARPIEATSQVAISDNGILVLASGVVAIAKQLDPHTRLPTRVLAQRSSGLLSATDVALAAGTDYASGLPVIDCGSAQALATPQPLASDAPTLVTVVGSTEDFEYQFPAAPQFFVGREELLSRVRLVSDDPVPAGRVIVLNAQSGWGKSSLALRIAFQAEKAGGFAVVFDTRTAASVSYVSNALRKVISEATARGKLSIPETSSFASLQSSLKTLQSASWHAPIAPLLIFFDQFENVFRDTRLTQEFRDLALAVRELAVPVLVGFSWKTDLVGLTENYPYRLRDEIRGSALVLNVEPFGPQEVGTLLGRLAKAAGTSVSGDLRQRLREYSQGLPWLLKKLASHILKQLQAGTSEETLLAESLNIERLFDHDLAALGATEIDALKAIAREAPVAVSDVVERVSPDVIQSLVDQRLLVRVGERLDVYWDIFREFILTGKVAIEDTYILRQRPHSTSKVLQEVVRAGGEASAADVAKSLSTSINVVFNGARELRQLGVLAPKSGSLLLVEQLRAGTPREEQIQERVAKALRRHTVFSTVQGLLGGSSNQVLTIDDLGKELPTVFPAVEATEKTWRTYAVAFAHWLDYAGLVELRGQVLCPSSATSKQRLLVGGGQGRQKTFPQTSAEVALRFLRTKLRPGGAHGMTASSMQKAINDWQVLGVLDDDAAIRDPAKTGDLLSGDLAVGSLHDLLGSVPGGQAALDLLKAKPRARPEDVGEILRVAYGLPWVGSTTRMAGTKFRSWASAAGTPVLKVGRRKPDASSQPSLAGLEAPDGN